MEELFFLANNLMISPLCFNVEIFEVAGGNMTGCFYITTHRELRDLAIFLKYNLMIFYLD